MKIVIATPLYPPDIAEPAPYVKELATRLAHVHTITIVLFGYLPETIPNVTIRSVDKRAWLPLRLWRFTRALWRASKQADVLYIMNGPSVELPATLVTFFTNTPMLVHHGDTDANEWIADKPLLRRIKHMAEKRAIATVATLPPLRPEILPFDPLPPHVHTEYEAAWQQHTQELETYFANLTPATPV